MWRKKKKNGRQTIDAQNGRDAINTILSSLIYDSDISQMRKQIRNKLNEINSFKNLKSTDVTHFGATHYKLLLIIIHLIANHI